MTFSASAEELEAASNAVYERTRASYTIKGLCRRRTALRSRRTAESTRSGMMPSMT